MALSTLDAKPALIVIDLQNGILAAPFAHPTAEIIDSAAKLAAAFRECGLPVVLVTVSGGAPGRTELGRARQSERQLPPGWAELAPELNARPEDFRLVKQRWGAFHGTVLHEHLQRLGVTQVVLAGIATSIGVESTARAAHENGYHVVLATDAMTDRDSEAHRNSVERIFPRLGETASALEIITLLRRRR
jgi:nicotinamidase-related amidase